ncbi:hypothetical protein [Actinomycetospora aeridis]|uniref:YbaB/EbfC DNA-binding family protein n=1 Tax=Actinomycetospora aeridis TaxID=3129231 RepID=A0ABU8N6C4_9PSEU
MDDRRWGFAGLSDDEYAAFARRDADVPAPARGEPGEVVVVTADGVRLADDWRARIDPRRLGAEVVAAAGRAVSAELAAAVRDPVSSPAGGPAPDLAPWGGSFARLVEDARRDVARFSAAASALQGRAVTRTSAGGHVAGSARHGVVTEVTVDPVWARGAHVRDLEAELTDVLVGLRRHAVPEAVSQGPTHPATVALRQLAGDPARVVRLAGMTS